MRRSLFGQYAGRLSGSKPNTSVMNPGKSFLLVVLGLLLVVSTLLVMPFLQYVLIALLLAYVLYPLQRRLEPRIGSALASMVLVVGATVALILPFVAMIGLIASDAMRLAGEIGEDDLALGPIEEAIEQYTGMEVDLAGTIGSSVENVVNVMIGSAADVFGALAHVAIGIGLAAFLLFFLLKDGEKLLAWIHQVTPLPQRVQDDLFGSLDSITRAVLLGHVAVAIIQGVIAGLGLIATGVPNAIFWTFVMIILALIPAIGSFLVWAPAAAWLVWTGSTGAGVALFVYGVIVVSVSDEFLRPLIVGRADLNPSLIIVGVVGGVYLMGFMGLFFGPIILGALKVTVEEIDQHYTLLEH